MNNSTICVCNGMAIRKYVRAKSIIFIYGFPASTTMNV